MAIVSGYTTLAAIKAVKEIDSVDSVDDTAIEDFITQASRIIDNLTGRTFYARTETRSFPAPEDGRTLEVDDDLLTVTTLTNGDTSVIASTYYRFLPRNKAPYYAIELLPSAPYVFLGGDDDAVTVAGTWGYSSTAPADIKQACEEIVLNIYGRRHGENTSGVATVTAAGVVITPQDIPSSAWAVIRKYARRT